ncbi:unnamed protein product [Meganyctiphanes norvegica]|uniref:C2H2-type domain-containing protein n=1 Tax=Meganyctiphanes norvegica TaxID=48144 RepID=A0AAV2ST13_MEGNR
MMNRSSETDDIHCFMAVNADIDLMVKEEIEVHEEPVLIQDVGVSVKQEWESNQCDKSFTSNSLLIGHNRTHTGETPYHCNQCDKNFSQNATLTVHQRTHSGEKPYKCNQCEKGFSRKDNLIVHQSIHSGEKPYQCNQCDKAFSRNNSCIVHQRTHSGEKPYQCNQCDKAFSQKGDIKKTSAVPHWGETISVQTM